MVLRSYSHTGLYLWTAVIAVVVAVFGLFSLGAGIGIISESPVTSDIPGGCILLLIGALFLTGLIEGREDPGRWVQFAYTGLFLVLIFGVCTLVISGATVITQLMQGEVADVPAILGSGFFWGAVRALPVSPKIRNMFFGCSCQGDI